MHFVKYNKNAKFCTVFIFNSSEIKYTPYKNIPLPDTLILKMYNKGLCRDWFVLIITHTIQGDYVMEGPSVFPLLYMLLYI
jgi:hypothetical protein